MNVITMVHATGYQAFKVLDDGTAIMDLGSSVHTIPDFAAFFIDLCENGWRKVTETTILMSKAKEKSTISCCKSESRKGILPQLSGFRSEWNDMWEDLVDNYDRG